MNNLVLYVTINYPTREKFFEILDVIEESNVGYVEIGIPVANPYVDGGVVRKTQEQVYPTLTQQEIISVLEEIRRQYSFRVILMTYHEGVEHFQLSQIARTLYDAILCVDKYLDQKNYTGLVHTFTHKLDQEILAEQLTSSSEFIYLVSGEGKTGEFTQLPNEYIPLLACLKPKTKLPIFVGFGVKESEDIISILNEGADGAIIGSEFIKRYDADGISGIKKYLQALQGAFDRGN